jgi:hypothetical protein
MSYKNYIIYYINIIMTIINYNIRANQYKYNKLINRFLFNKKKKFR